MKQYGPDWDRYGLTLRWPESVSKSLVTAVRCHNLVSRYLSDHPEEHEELFYPNGDMKYFLVLSRAEREYDYDARENHG